MENERTLPNQAVFINNQAILVAIEAAFPAGTGFGPNFPPAANFENNQQCIARRNLLTEILGGTQRLPANSFDAFQQDIVPAILPALVADSNLQKATALYDTFILKSMNAISLQARVDINSPLYPAALSQFQAGLAGRGELPDLPSVTVLAAVNFFVKFHAYQKKGGTLPIVDLITAGVKAVILRDLVKFFPVECGHLDGTNAEEVDEIFFLKYTLLRITIIQEPDKKNRAAPCVKVHDQIRRL